MTLPAVILKSNPQDIYLKGSPLVLDVETSNLEKGNAINRHNRLLLACWTYKGKRKHCWGGEYEQQQLLKDIQAADFIVAHNAKFELGWLSRCGLELRDVLVYDTMLAEWVLLGNLSHGLHDLSLSCSCERRELPSKHDVVASLIHTGVDPQNIPPEWLLEYCHQDVAITEQLFRKQLELLEEKRLLHIQYSRCLLTPVLVDMESNGVTLDPERVNEEYQRVYDEHTKTLAALDAMAVDSNYAGINWRSRPQVGEFLYDVLQFEELTDRKGNPIRTGKDARKTDSGTILALKAKNARQREFVSLYTKAANLNARLTKALTFFKGVCDEYGNTFYGSYNQGSTKTHRLSSSGRAITLAPSMEGEKRKTVGAQLQNLPREYKRLFTAKRKDWWMVEIDSGQLEFRAAAILTGDAVASEEIIGEADVHRITADYLTEHGEPTSRQDAKSRTFRPLFAGSSGTKAEQAYCKFFQEKYHAMYTSQYGWCLEVLKNKELVTPYGMRYYWPSCKMQGSGYITHTTEIFNAPIQGFATAEIIPIGVVCAWHRLRGAAVRFILTIHDSIVLEVHPDVDRDWLNEQLALAFTADVYNFLDTCYNYRVSRVPLSAGIKWGVHWGEGKEIQATVYPDDKSNTIHWKAK